jgi:hypothetical protein
MKVIQNTKNRIIIESCYIPEHIYEEMQVCVQYR